MTNAPLQVLYPAVSSSSGVQTVPYIPSHGGLPASWGISLQLADTQYPQPFWPWSCSIPLSWHSAGTILTPSTAPGIPCRAKSCRDVLGGLSDASNTAGEIGPAWKQKPLWSAPQICSWNYIFNIQMPDKSQVTFINLGFTSTSWLNTQNKLIFPLISIRSFHLKLGKFYYLLN